MEEIKTFFVDGVTVLGSLPGVRCLEITHGLLRLHKECPSPAAGKVLDLEGCLVFPGLFNSHDHLEFNCYPRLGQPPYQDEVAWAVEVRSGNSDLIAAVEKVPLDLRVDWGIAKNLLCGVTAVLSHGRYQPGLFQDSPIEIIEKFDFIHSVHGQPNWRREMLKFWRREPVVIHLGEGVNETTLGDVERFAPWLPLRRRVIAVHGLTLPARLAKRLAALVWCPESNLFLFGRTADIARLKRETLILFGTDSSISARGTYWDHLRTARRIGALDDAELFAAATSGAAKTWGQGNRGRIADGGEADIVVARRKHEDDWEAFFAIEPADILLVLRRGRVLLADDSTAGTHPWVLTGERKFFTVRVGATVKHLPLDISALAARIRSIAPSAMLSLEG